MSVSCGRDPKGLIVLWGKDSFRVLYPYPISLGLRTRNESDESGDLLESLYAVQLIDQIRAIRINRIPETQVG